MNLRDYAHILRARWRAIAAAALAAVAMALALSVTATPTYRASTTLFVTTSNSGSSSSDAYVGALFSQQRVKSYAVLVTSPAILKPVRDQLGIPLTDAALAGMVSASAPTDKTLIELAVTDTSPERAVAITNAVASQFSTYVREIESTDLAQPARVKLTVIKPATSAGQVSPRPRLNLAMGLLLGLAVGVGAAVLREQLDTRLKGQRQLQDDFGLATLGVISFDPDTPARPLIVQIPSASPRAEAFRQLRTNLQYLDVDSPPRSLVITSALPSDGKSTTTCNIAIALAEAGQKVLLVDGDLRRPKLAEYLGLEGSVGLSDVLAGRVQPEDVIQQWGTTGALGVLLAGASPPNPAELLGSQHMADLIADLEKDYFVIVDAPPLLPVTDAAILAKVTSGAVVVVRAARTKADELRQAMTNLETVGAKLYGAIINMAPIKGPDARRYGYAYSYGYSSGPERPEAGSPTGVPVAPSAPLSRTDPSAAQAAPSGTGAGPAAGSSLTMTPPAFVSPASEDQERARSASRSGVLVDDAQRPAGQRNWTPTEPREADGDTSAARDNR